MRQKLQNFGSSIFGQPQRVIPHFKRIPDVFDNYVQPINILKPFVSTYDIRTLTKGLMTYGDRHKSTWT